MNFNTLIDVEFSGRLCLTLLHSVWQVTLLAVAVWCIDRIWGRRSVEKSYVLHVAVLMVGLAAMPITFWLVEIGGAGGPAAVVHGKTGAVEIAAPVPDTLPTAVPLAFEEPVPAVAPVDPTAAIGDLSAVPDTVVSAPVTTLGGDLSVSWTRVAPWIVATYALGVFAMLARLMGCIWHTRRLGSMARLISDGPAAEALNRLARKWSMRVVPALAQTERIAVPKIVGLLRPTILLPGSAITGLSPNQLEMILVHELSHARRYDMWINLLQRLAEVVLFFNPALWYLNRRISTLREYCCDELTCRTMFESGSEPRARYAGALLRVVELSGQVVAGRSRDRSPGHDELAALAASGRSPSQLRRRVARLFGEPLREPLRISPCGMLTLAGFMLLGLFGPPLWTTDEPTVKPVEASVAASDNAEKEGQDTASVPAKNPQNYKLQVVGPDGKPVPRASVASAATSA